MGNFVSETAGGIGTEARCRAGGQRDVIIWDPWQELGPGHSLCLLATAYLAASRLPGRQGRQTFFSPALEGWTMP